MLKISIVVPTGLETVAQDIRVLSNCSKDTSIG